MSAADGAGSLEQPVWFAPLRSPSWLVPDVRDDAPRLVFRAEPWEEGAVDAAGRDLRLGLPLYLAEAARFGTNARPSVLRAPVAVDGPMPDAMTVRSEVAPDGGGSIRLRVLDARGSVHAEVEREAHDEETLGAALATLPHEVSTAAAAGGVRPVWNSMYRLPVGAGLAAYVRGLHASTRILEDALPASAGADALVARRADVSAVLGSLGVLATSASGPFPALLFFGAVLSARDVGSPVVGGYRLQVNARCTAATDPLDPVFAMTALVARVFGDLVASERRIAQLRAGGDASIQQWLDRVEGVT